MSKIIKVTYNDDTLETTIIVDGKEFDTSRINGKEIADWAYPFMMRKVHWNGFYDEMVKALDGEKVFDLVFEGSDEALAEMKEAWEDAPINVIAGEQGNIVTIIYDADTLSTEITVNGQVFDTSRINGKEIEDWVYPFMMRKVKWNGIFNELKNVLGTNDYKIQFIGTSAAMKVLMEECPEVVTINFEEIITENANADESELSVEAIELENEASALDDEEKYEESFNLRLKAAELGNVVSMSNLGWHYQYGNGVEQDYEKAFSFYKKAADSGNAWAQRKTGLCYEEGIGVEQDMSEAVNWYLKAAEQGQAESQWALGICYLNGIGVDEDDSVAVEWFSKSAEQNFVKAESALGDCYLNGYGVEEDEVKAIKWFEKAALQDDAYSQSMMGIAYASNNTYVNQNSEIALEWFEKSIANGNNLNPQVYMQMIYCLKDIGFTKMDKNGVGYKEAAQTYPEFKRITEICEFAINNFECNNSENGAFYLELAFQYGYVENWDEAIKYSQMAANYGVDRAVECLANYKKAKIANVSYGVAGKVADALGFGSAFRFGEAIGNNDNSDSIVSKGADFFKSLF